MAKRKKKKLPSVMEYDPSYQNFDGYLQVPDDQPGLPGNQKVNSATSQGRSRIGGQIHEEPMKSQTISAKIDEQLRDELVQPRLESVETYELLGEMMNLAEGGFKSQEEFASYLTEGTLLNINKLASSYIGVPAGEYVVWSVTPQTAILVPSSIGGDAVFAESPSSVEIHTHQLVGAWDKLQRTISEKEEHPEKHLTSKRFSKKETIQKADRQSKYPNDSKVKGGYEASGKSQKELAAACGVKEPQISRIKKQSGEGARDPSIQTGICLAKAAGKSVEDMFGGAQERETRGATSGRGKGTGSPYAKSESIGKKLAIMESRTFGPKENQAIVVLEGMRPRPENLRRSNGTVRFDIPQTANIRKVVPFMIAAAKESGLPVATEWRGTTFCAKSDGEVIQEIAKEGPKPWFGQEKPRQDKEMSKKERKHARSAGRRAIKKPESQDEQIDDGYSAGAQSGQSYTGP